MSLAHRPVPPDHGPPPGRSSRLVVLPLRAAEQHVLVVVGEADLHTAAHLRRQIVSLLPVEPPSLVIELGALHFCDLAGLDALRDGVRAAEDLGVATSLRGMSPQLTWLHHTFPARTPVQRGVRGVPCGKRVSR